MKTIYSLLIAITFFFVAFLLCYFSGFMLEGRTKAWTWCDTYKNALFVIPLFCFLIGFFVANENLKKH